MGRAERRKLEKKNRAASKEVLMTITKEDLIRIKKNATNAAIDTAFELMLGIPTMVILDKYNQLSDDDLDGKGRAEKFVELCLDLYDSFDKGYLSLDDIRDCLWTEGGIKIEKRR